MQNTVTLSIALVLCYHGFTTLQSLQSSVFPQIGIDSLCTLYSFAALSCLFAPTIVLKIGLRWTSLLYGILSVLYMISFYFYNDYGFIASSLVLGVSFGPMFCACISYLSSNISRLPFVTQIMRDKIQQRYLKIFCIITKSNFFLGNLVTSLVMHFNVENVKFITSPTNSTKDTTEIFTSKYDLCFQVHLKDSTLLQDFSKMKEDFYENDIVIQFYSLHQNSVRALVLIFSTCIALGVLLILVFLEKIEFLLQQDPMERPLILQTLRQIRLVFLDKHIRLTIPLVIFIGIEQGFIFADFTRVSSLLHYLAYISFNNI